MRWVEARIALDRKVVYKHRNTHPHILHEMITIDNEFPFQPVALVLRYDTKFELVHRIDLNTL